MQMIREILPNGIPIIIDAELDEDGSVKDDSIRIYPIFDISEDGDGTDKQQQIVGENFPTLEDSPELALRLIKQLQ